MKAILVLISLSIAFTAQAKLSDFNDIIEENVKAQNELHSNLTTNLSETKLAVQDEKRERFLVDSSSTINVPTKKSFLTFAKEKNYFRASEKQAKKRLAVEVESAD
jgi:hypothetical protein